MALNRELMQRTIEAIEAHPEQHAQYTWRDTYGCRTTMCFAGWACELAGGIWSTAYEDLLIPEGDEPLKDARGVLGHVHPEDRARRILGLDAQDATDLFYADRADVLDRARHLLAIDPNQKEATT